MFLHWLPLGLVATLCIGTSYLVGQQVLRQSAYDPAVQLSTDIARSMSTGQPSSSDTSGVVVDMANSLAPFTIVYDSAGTPISGTGKLNGHFVTPPPGVFAYATAHKGDRFTWEPDAGVRIATVITPVGGSGGFVLAGRNMSEVERRIVRIGDLSLLAWLVTFLASFAAVVVIDRLHARRAA